MALQSQVLEYGGERFAHHYLCHYRPHSAGADDLSKSLIRFKNGWPIDLEAWTTCTIEEFFKLPFEKNVLMIRALHSHERTVDENKNSSLEKLCRSASQKLNFIYQPNLLSKNKDTRPAKSLSKVERESELADAYQFTPSSEFIDEILIMDDILTTGQTMRAILRSIRRVSPSPISLYTLACTDRQSSLNTSLKLRGSAYQWETKQGWILAEDSVPYRSAVELLRNQIDDNFLIK